jgi:hypothetical protein
MNATLRLRCSPWHTEMAAFSQSSPHYLRSTPQARDLFGLGGFQEPHPRSGVFLQHTACSSIDERRPR